MRSTEMNSTKIFFLHFPCPAFLIVNKASEGVTMWLLFHLDHIAFHYLKYHDFVTFEKVCLSVPHFEELLQVFGTVPQFVELIHFVLVFLDVASTLSVQQ